MRSGTTLLLAAVLAVSACKNTEGASSASRPSQASGTSTPVTTVSAAAPESAPAAASPKVYRWTDEVTLTGTLVEKEVLSAKGGSIKTTFLELDAPISVHDEPSGEKFGTYDGERELWYAKDGKPLPPDMIGKRVTFHGRLNPMQTGHHHSNVWLTGDVTPLP